MSRGIPRIQDEPAFVVHRYDWSESSLILETFTRHFGRVALVAKGAKNPALTFAPCCCLCSRCTSAIRAMPKFAP